MKLDDEQRFDDERAAAMRERDRGREPRPRWRRPQRDLANRDAFRTGLADLSAAATWSARESASRERASLADAIFDLLASPLDRDELLGRVLEEWGDCTGPELGCAIGDLVRAGDVRRVGERYERRGSE